MLTHEELIEQSQALARQVSQTRHRCQQLADASEAARADLLRLEGAEAMARKLLAASHEAEQEKGRQIPVAEYGKAGCEGSSRAE